jgi:hypothetical protein
VLPASYAAPAAIVLVIGGLLACFAGYRLFRIVLGLYGFILGAAITTSALGNATTFSLVLAAVVGGIVGAVLMISAYFIGVALVGALLASVVLSAGWHLVAKGDPPTIVLVIVAVLGALLALSVVRYVVVFGTALAGSWTAIVGAVAFMNGRGPAAAGRSASLSDLWVIYPNDPTLHRWWITIGWLVLALAGAAVQLSTTTKMAGVKRPRSKP